MKPNRYNKLIVAASKCRIKGYELQKTMSFIRAGAGAVYELDPTDQYTISMDTERYYPHSKMVYMAAESIWERISQDNRN